MCKFKRGDKVIEPRTGDIGAVKYYDSVDEIMVKWETGHFDGESLLIHESEVELYTSTSLEDEAMPTEIMYKGKIYVLKGE